MSSRTLQQQRAVDSDSPEIVVVAGPGSGKTSTSIARTKRLIDSGVPESAIVALTFTNAAARETERRLLKSVSESLVVPEDCLTVPPLGYCGTLHGFALKMLKRLGIGYGYGRRMGVLGEESGRELLASIADRLHCREAVDRLWKYKATGRPVAVGGRLSLWETVVATYYDELKASGLVDFDILLTEFLAFLRQPGTAGLFETCGYTHLFVDEVQDSGEIDWRIFDALPIKNKFLVGDPDQSIYAFRGGDPNRLIARVASIERDLNPSLLRDGPVCGEVVYLEQNFRSRPVICAAAQRLIENNRVRVGKSTVSARKPDPRELDDLAAGRPVGVCILPSAINEGDEAALISRHIEEEFCRGTAVGEIAVLARSNAVVYELSKVLAAVGIPVSKKEESALPKDWGYAAKLVELFVNPENDLLAYFLAREKFGPAKADDIRREAAANRWRIADRLPGTFPAGARASDAPRLLTANGVSLESVMIVSERIRLLPPDAEMIELAANLTAKTERVEAPRGAAVEVVTIHAAKGREWDVVFIAGFEEEIIPSRRRDVDVEEERRLAYVAVTRARERVYITSARTRREKWGAFSNHEISRFALELASKPSGEP